MSDLFFVARLTESPRRLDCSRGAWHRRVIRGEVPRGLLCGSESMAVNAWVPLDTPGEYLGEVNEANVEEGFCWAGYVRDLSEVLNVGHGEFVAGPWQTKTEALRGLDEIKELIGRVQ